ncbi:hypothetical protein T05_7720 [Trichinella murrelli]|uniref:Uncharacterized protein n=1 Tax=Trichinella murrelli TaxID=144512 RepID=A0A0V0U9Y0_9BILA|nr:hypothetical protein T05_7720 [Trichinella murrelli]
MNLELRRDSGEEDNESLPANGPKQHSVQPAPVQKQSSDIYLNATLVEEKFIEFVEYFIRRVIISKTGPIRTVVVRQKATVDKLAMVGIRNETLKWKRDVEFCAKIKLPKDCVIYAVSVWVKTSQNKQQQRRRQWREFLNCTNMNMEMKSSLEIHKYNADIVENL